VAGRASGHNGFHTPVMSTLAGTAEPSNKKANDVKFGSLLYCYCYCYYYHHDYHYYYYCSAPRLGWVRHESAKK